MGFFDALRGKETVHDLDEEVYAAVPDLFRRATVTGHIHRVDGTVCGKGLLVEDKDVDVAAVAGDHDERRCRRVLVAQLQELYLPPADLDRLWGGAALTLFLRDEVLLKLLDEGVYLVIRYIGSGDHAKQTPDREDVALVRDATAQDAGGRGFDGVVDLLGLHLDDFIAV